MDPWRETREIQQYGERLQIEFMKLRRRDPIPEDYRLASMDDLRSDVAKKKLRTQDVISHRDIVRLRDGWIEGSAYSNLVPTPRFRPAMDHKLAIKLNMFGKIPKQFTYCRKVLRTTKAEGGNARLLSGTRLSRRIRAGEGNRESWVRELLYDCEEGDEESSSSSSTSPSLTTAEFREVIAALLSQPSGNRVFPVDEETGWTALHSASINPNVFFLRDVVIPELRNAGILDKLVNMKTRKGVDIDFVYLLVGRQWTPLHSAVTGIWSSSAETIKLLLEHGADPNILDGHGRTPFLLAVQRDCLLSLITPLVKSMVSSIRRTDNNTLNSILKYNLKLALPYIFSADPDTDGKLAKHLFKMLLPFFRIDDFIDMRLLMWNAIDNSHHRCLSTLLRFFPTLNTDARLSRLTDSKHQTLLHHAVIVSRRNRGSKSEVDSLITNCIKPLLSYTSRRSSHDQQARKSEMYDLFWAEDETSRIAYDYAPHELEDVEEVVLKRLVEGLAGAGKDREPSLMRAAKLRKMQLSHQLLKAIILYREKHRDADDETVMLRSDLRERGTYLQERVLEQQLEDKEWKDKLSSREKVNIMDVLKSLTLETILQDKDELDQRVRQATDQPTPDDILGRKPLADALAALILNPYVGTPITIGIYGDWGIGKSSLMLQVEICLFQIVIKQILTQYEQKDIQHGWEINELIEHIIKSLDKKDKDKFRQLRSKGDSYQKDLLDEFSSKYNKRYHSIYKSLAQSDMSKLFSRTSMFTRRWSIMRTWRICGEFLARLLWNWKSPTTTAEHESIKEEEPDDDEEVSEEDDDQEEEKGGGGRFRHSVCFRKKQIPTTTTKTEHEPKLSTPSILTVHYNAWQYQDQNQAVAGLANEVSKEIELAMNTAQWISMCWSNSMTGRRHGRPPILLFCTSLFTLAFAGLATWLIWVLLSSSSNSDIQRLKYGSVPLAITAIFWAVLRQVYAFIQPVSKSLKSMFSPIDHQRNLGYHQQVVEDIQFLMRELRRRPSCIWRFLGVFAHIIRESRDHVEDTKIPKQIPSENLRIIVFVDDLDRCTEDTIMQVLTSINLVLSVCELNVILGVDKSVILRIIKSKFAEKDGHSAGKDGHSAEKNRHSAEKDEKDGHSAEKDGHSAGNDPAEDLAEKFLEKIVQLPVVLPDPGHKRVEEFLEGQMGFRDRKFRRSTRSKQKTDTSLVTQVHRLERESMMPICMRTSEEEIPCLAHESTTKENEEEDDKPGEPDDVQTPIKQNEEEDVETPIRQKEEDESGEQDNVEFLIKKKEEDVEILIKKKKEDEPGGPEDVQTPVEQNEEDEQPGEQEDVEILIKKKKEDVEILIKKNEEDEPGGPEDVQTPVKKNEEEEPGEQEDVQILIKKKEEDEAREPEDVRNPIKKKEEDEAGEADAKENEETSMYGEDGLVDTRQTVTFARYTAAECAILKELQKYTDRRKTVHPREWKRLLNYHRLAYNVVSQKENVMQDWKAELMVWVFVCWNWKELMNEIIEEWDDLRGHRHRSLKDIVEAKAKDKHNSESNRLEWENMTEALKKTNDVSMESIVMFQDFRFRCNRGFLQSPTTTDTQKSSR